MFRQDCPEIADFSIGKSKFKDTGCAVCCAFHHAEQVKGRFYSPDKVEKLCISMLSDGIIDKDFTVMSWDEIFLYLGIPVRTRFEHSGYICKGSEIEILKLQKPGFTHFVPGDGNGNYSWDSLGRRPAQSEYYVADKRIMRLV